MNAIFCSNCRSQSAFGSVYCYACGTPFIQRQPIKTATETFKSFSIYFGIAIGVVCLFCGMFYVLNKIQPLPASNSTPTVELVASETGFYLDYKYTVMKKDGKIAALFQPKMLPRNDEIFIGATRKVIKQGFSEDTYKEPFLVGKSIMFPGSSCVYAVVPIKEDTGEVHSLVIERIKKE